LVKGKKTVKITVGSPVIMIDGEAKTMDVVPEIAEPGRVMLPARLVAEAFDATVTWDGATREVSIGKV